MQLKFKNKQLKIELKLESGEVIGDLLLNPDNPVQRNKMFSLYQRLQEKAGIIEDLEKEKESENFAEKVIKLEADAFEFLNNELADIYGDIIFDLSKATGNDLETFVDLVKGLIPYYKEATEKNVQKYLNENK